MKLEILFCLGSVSNNTYRNVEEGGFVEGPTLDEVEEGLLRLLDVHADEGLVVHGHMLLL
jgi:hypothetical protein